MTEQTIEYNKNINLIDQSHEMHVCTLCALGVTWDATVILCSQP